MTQTIVYELTIEKNKLSLAKKILAELGGTLKKPKNQKTSTLNKNHKNWTDSEIIQFNSQNASNSFDLSEDDDNLIDYSNPNITDFNLSHLPK
jgi:hypothetical protein